MTECPLIWQLLTRSLFKCRPNHPGVILSQSYLEHPSTHLRCLPAYILHCPRTNFHLFSADDEYEPRAYLWLVDPSQAVERGAHRNGRDGVHRFRQGPPRWTSSDSDSDSRISLGYNFWLPIASEDDSRRIPSCRDPAVPRSSLRVAIAEKGEGSQGGQEGKSDSEAFGERVCAKKGDGAKITHYYIFAKRRGVHQNS